MRRYSEEGCGRYECKSDETCFHGSVTQVVLLRCTIDVAEPVYERFGQRSQANVWRKSVD